MDFALGHAGQRALAALRDAADGIVSAIGT